MEENNGNNYEMQIGKLIHTAGTLQLTDTEKEKLYNDIKPEEILIKKDGTIFAPWTAYVKRLNDAFTGTGWAMIPQGNPIEKKGYIYWGFHLMLKGCYCGFAYGQIEYSGDKDYMTWGNAIEAAKSNALMRLCKELGIGLKMWDKKFIEDWQSKHAHQDRTGDWKLGAPPANHQAPFNESVLQAKLEPIMTEEALKKEWDALDEDLQRLPAIFAIFKKHITRVKALPKKVEKIYGIMIESQQIGVQDFEKEVSAYSTAVEIEVNLETVLKEYVEKGFMKENLQTLRAVASRIIKEKRDIKKREPMKVSNGIH